MKRQAASGLSAIFTRIDFDVRPANVRIVALLGVAHLLATDAKLATVTIRFLVGMVKRAL
jgi:hypothetical protein